MVALGSEELKINVDSKSSKLPELLYRDPLPPHRLVECIQFYHATCMMQRKFTTHARSRGGAFTAGYLSSLEHPSLAQSSRRSKILSLRLVVDIDYVDRGRFHLHYSPKHPREEVRTYVRVRIR